jgi:hypothetical protein
VVQAVVVEMVLFTMPQVQQQELLILVVVAVVVLLGYGLLIQVAQAVQASL